MRIRSPTSPVPPLFLNLLRASAALLQFPTRCTPRAFRTFLPKLIQTYFFLERNKCVPPNKLAKINRLIRAAELFHYWWRHWWRINLEAAEETNRRLVKFFHRINRKAQVVDLCIIADDYFQFFAKHSRLSTAKNLGAYHATWLRTSFVSWANHSTRRSLKNS